MSLGGKWFNRFYYAMWFFYNNYCDYISNWNTFSMVSKYSVILIFFNWGYCMYD